MSKNTGEQNEDLGSGKPEQPGATYRGASCPIILGDMTALGQNTILDLMRTTVYHQYHLHNWYKQATYEGRKLYNPFKSFEWTLCHVYGEV